MGTAIRIRDRCGGVTVGSDPCICASPFDPAEVDTRHREAAGRARTVDGLASAAPTGGTTTE